MEQKLYRFQKQLDFIIEIDKVKQIIRQTLLLDSSRQENDAEHSWHMALALFVFKEHANFGDIDMAKAVKMALIHDLVEIDAGDTFAYDKESNRNKEEKETKAAKRIFGLLPMDMKEEFIAIWEEFEKSETPEAKYVNAIDRFMPILHNYKTNGKSWKKHHVNADMVKERNRPIKEGSAFLWTHVLKMIEGAKLDGIL